MSVLSQPQGTPERVWSLIDGLQAAGGILQAEDYSALLNPGYVREGNMVAISPTQAKDATGVSTNLNLVVKEEDNYRLVGTSLITSEIFPDLVHDIFLACAPGEPDAVMLDAYAWLIAESHRRKDLAWCTTMDNNSFVDAMRAGLKGEDDDGSRTMNTTRLPAWRRWQVFLGLCQALPATEKTNYWHFSPARRIARELVRAKVPIETSISLTEFLGVVAERCPYLDGGSKFSSVCNSLGYVHSPRELSAALTVGLRELEADGLLEFSLIGDSSDAVQFLSDPSFRTNSFNRVSVRGSLLQ